MTFIAERKGVVALGMTALTSRLMFGALVDMPDLGNGIWIALVTALLMGLPLSLLLDRASASFHAPGTQVLEQALGRGAACLFYIPAFVLMVWDAACDGRMLNCVSNYFALSARSLLTVFGVTMLVITLGSLSGFQSITCVAQIWLRFVPLVLIILLPVLIPRAHWGWLFPLLGGQVTNSIRAGFVLGGHCALISLLFLSAEPAPDKNDFMTTKILCASILLCALVALMARVMSPYLPMQPATRMLAIERLLANERAPMTLQLLTMIASYSNLLLTCAFDLLMSGHLLKRILPRLPEWLCLILSSALCLLVGLMGWAEQYAARFLNSFRYMVLALPAFALACAALIRQKRRPSAHE